MFFFELIGQILNDAHVKVFPAKERIPVGGFNFKDAVADFQNRHIERTATKVIDRDGASVCFVETVGKRCRSWLVDDAQHFKSGNLASIFCSLALGVVEIGRHRDNSLGDGLTGKLFCRLFHLLQNESRHLLW